MNAVFTILTVVIVILSILLTIVVLLQNGKGEGMASNFVTANQTLGVRETASILEKLSWALVSIIVVLSIVSTIVLGAPGSSANDYTESIQDAAQTEQLEFPSAPIQQSAPATEAAPATETPAE